VAQGSGITLKSLQQQLALLQAQGKKELTQTQVTFDSSSSTTTTSSSSSSSSTSSSFFNILFYSDRSNLIW
jgi:hypothetical protein